MENINRDKLYNSMQLQNNIRQVKDEELKIILKEKIKKVNTLLNNIETDKSNYLLSSRQEKTKENAINKMQKEDYLKSYYEIMDFVDNYGDSHNGIVYEIERQELKNLLVSLYEKIKIKTD